MPISSKMALNQYIKFATFVLACGLAACTSKPPGNGSGIPGVNSPTSLNPTQLTTAMTPTLTYSDTEWAAAIGSIQTLVNTADVPNASLGTRAQRILSAVQASPFVFDAGLTTVQNVWMRLKDGTPVSVSLDRNGYKTGDPDPLATPWAQAHDPQNTLRKFAWLDSLKFGVRGLLRQGISEAYAQTGALYGLPVSQTAFVSQIGNLAPHASAQISQMLSAHRYQVTGQSNPTMDFFRNGVRNFGVFWFSTHGVYYADASGVQKYGFVTGDIINGPCTGAPGVCAANKADIAAGRGFVGMTPAGDSAIAINAAFVAKYFRFSADSLVFLDACNSASETYENNAFIDAMRSAQAGTFLGWTSVVGAGYAEKAATWFFDRVLGANQYSPPSPKQRPFSAPEVFESMRKVGKDKDPGGDARLSLKKLSPRDGILRPSIRNLEVDENKDQLLIHGQFGETPGTGEMGGALAIGPWSSDQIEAVITPTQSGDAIVRVGNRESNVVPLTNWVGRYSAKQYLKFGFGNPGPRFEITCTRLHMRGDVHRYRTKPEETPVSGTMRGECNDPTIYFHNMVRDSACTATWGGQGTRTTADATVVTEFTPVGMDPLSWIDHTQAHIPYGWFFMVTTLNTASRQLRLNVNNLGTTEVPMRTTVTDRNGTRVSTGSYLQSSAGQVGCAMNTMHPEAMDTSFNINVSLANRDVACFPGSLPSGPCDGASPGIPGGVPGSPGGGGFNLGDKFDADLRLTTDPATLPDSDTES